MYFQCVIAALEVQYMKAWSVVKYKGWEQTRHTPMPGFQMLEYLYTCCPTLNTTAFSKSEQVYNGLGLPTGAYNLFETHNDYIWYVFNI